MSWNYSEKPQQRNYQCPKYETCLDAAALADTDMTCSGCAYEHDTSGTLDLAAELPGLLRLLWVLFMDDRAYSRLRAEQRLFGRCDWQDPVHRMPREAVTV
jgi:hypothetical protein